MPEREASGCVGRLDVFGNAFAFDQEDIGALIEDPAGSWTRSLGRQPLIIADAAHLWFESEPALRLLGPPFLKRGPLKVRGLKLRQDLQRRLIQEPDALILRADQSLVP